MMSVYVDDMKAGYQPAHRPGRKYVMSHMVADSIQELHEMADQIGVARKWFQGDHYDICQSKRLIAVQRGAIEVTMRQIVEVRRKFRLHRQIELEASAYNATLPIGAGAYRQFKQSGEPAICPYSAERSGDRLDGAREAGWRDGFQREKERCSGADFEILGAPRVVAHRSEDFNS